MRLEELLKLAGVKIAESRLNEIGEYDVVDDEEYQDDDDYGMEEPMAEPEAAEPEPDPFADGPEVSDADIAAALNKWAPKPKFDPNAELAGPYDKLGGGRDNSEAGAWADSEEAINLQKEIERKNAELARKKAERAARAAAMDSDFGAGEEGDEGFDINRLKKLSGI